MSKQVQIRRDTATNLGTVIPAAGEPGYDTTNKRLIVGDGSTSGGIPHANYLDVQKGTFVYATSGGSANAQTLTLAPSPGAYAAGQSFRFKAGFSNTTAATLNVNGLGAKNMYKSKGGILQALASGDVVAGNMYVAHYDGTQFQLHGVEPTTVAAGITPVSGSPFTTTGSAAIESTGFSGGNDLVITGTGLSCATAGRTLLLKPRIAGAYGGTVIYRKTIDTTTVGANNSVVSFFPQNNNQLAADVSEFNLRIFDYADTAHYKKFTGMLRVAAGTYISLDGHIATLSAIDGLKLYWGTGANEAESAVNFDGSPSLSIGTRM